MRAQFILSEIVIGLRRNLTMTVACIITLTVSLFVVGVSLLATKQVDVMKGYWYDKVEVTVYLCGTTSTSKNCADKAVTQEQREQLGRDLNAMPQVENVFYESKVEAYERFRQQFKESPDLVDNVGPDALPESYRVKLEDPEQFDIVASAFQDRPGVDAVQDLKKALEPLFDVLSKLRLVGFIGAGAMLLAAVLLISNMVRVAAFSRRRETGIMRLVGASNLYIQLPFLLEGALTGFVGGTLAAGLLVLGKWWVIDQVLAPTFKFTDFVDWGDTIVVMPVLALLGVVLSSAASFLTLRRHLRV